jgi:hypothetical protein
MSDVDTFVVENTKADYDMVLYYMLFIDGMNAGDWFDVQDGINAYFNAEQRHPNSILTLVEFSTSDDLRQEIVTNKTPKSQTVFQV